MNFPARLLVFCVASSLLIIGSGGCGKNADAGEIARSSSQQASTSATTETAAQGEHGTEVSRGSGSVPNPKATYPAPDCLRVPAVLGADRTTANAALAKAGFFSVDESAGAGVVQGKLRRPGSQVLHHIPSGGTCVSEETTIQLSYSAPES